MIWMNNRLTVGKLFCTAPPPVKKLIGIWILSLIILLAVSICSGSPRIINVFSVAFGLFCCALLSNSQCAPDCWFICFIVSPPRPMITPHLFAGTLKVTSWEFCRRSSQPPKSPPPFLLPRSKFSRRPPRPPPPPPRPLFSPSRLWTLSISSSILNLACGIFTLFLIGSSLFSFSFSYLFWFYFFSTVFRLVFFLTVIRFLNCFSFAKIRKFDFEKNSINSPVPHPWVSQRGNTSDPRDLRPWPAETEP